MAPTQTPSQANAAAMRQFVPTLHTDVYAAIDPSTTKFPQPFTAVILGGSGAVGGGLARSYARAGATAIVLAARRLELVQAVADEAKAINPTVKTLTLKCDISSPYDVAAVADSTKTHFGATVGAVVVNAGYSGPMINDITQETAEDFHTAFNVNTLGTVYAAQSFIPILKEAVATSPASYKGVFIGISSMAAPTINGLVAHISYCASKFAQTRVIEMLKEQQQQQNGGVDDGILFTALHPGGVKSELSTKNIPEEFIPCTQMPFYFPSCI
jgi:NAD(P)-dependent dehydrogenase (short-subunit alcohol dehydrogenase family)